MTLDPKVWGPHYWFVLHTIALKYPLNPNTTIKKKYYDFILSVKRGVRILINQMVNIHVN